MISSLPPTYSRETLAENQEVRVKNIVTGAVMWIEPETSQENSYAIFHTENPPEEVADIVEKGFNTVDEAEVELEKIMEEDEETDKNSQKAQVQEYVEQTLSGYSVSHSAIKNPKENLKEILIHDIDKALTDGELPESRGEEFK